MRDFLLRWKHHFWHLTRLQLLTLRGQALAGDLAGADKGLERVLQNNRRILR